MRAGLHAQVGTLNYMSPEAILGGATNIRGGPPMKVPPQRYPASASMHHDW